MANFHRSSLPTKLNYFGFSFITVLCIISTQVLLCSARPNLDDSIEKKFDDGVSKSIKELPLIEEDNGGGLNDGEQDDPEIEDQDYDSEDTGDANQFPKIYVEPREILSTSSTITPKIQLSSTKAKNEHTDDENADESQTESTTMTVEPPSIMISDENTINTSNCLIQKTYCVILFIPVLSYFLM